MKCHGLEWIQWESPHHEHIDKRLVDAVEGGVDVDVILRNVPHDKCERLPEDGLCEIHRQPHLRCVQQIRALTIRIQFELPGQSFIGIVNIS